MGGSGTAPGMGDVSRTGSTKGTFKRNGETLAKPHYNPKPFSISKPPPGESTMSNAFKDPNEKAPCIPYDPNALRNRLPVEFKNAPKARARFCFPRNNHTYDFLSGNTPPGYNSFRTTNQNFYAYDTRMLETGESNQGIVSERIKELHKSSLA